MDRSFERQCNIKISLQNIAQLRIINAQGQMTSASWSNLTGAANRALVGARWNVDPTGIPATMHQTWLAIEFGDYPSAAAGLKRSLNSRKRETKAAAEKLQAYVQAKIDSDLKVANEALESEKKWDAYKTLTRAQIMFKGYKLPRDFAAQVRSLAADDSVKKERAAMKRFESASKAINSKSVSSHKRGMSILKKLVAGSPDTEAATRATTLLKAIESSVNP